MADRALNLDDFLSRFQLLRPQPSRHALDQRQAAVLVPIVRRPQPGLLLTQRSPLLRKHAGQVAFPGGAVDNTDATLIAAALREAQEEVAIPPEAVEGDRRPAAGGQRHRLSGDAGGGHHSPDLHYHASQDEVSAVFEMPLAEALRLGRYHPLDIHRRGNDHRVWLSWYQHYFVWGMTAGIIRELALQIGARP
ncbi:CoA pyrophosphatase [Klebsiella pneumoniae]